MSQQTSIVVSIASFSMLSILFIWWLCAFRKGKLSAEPVKQINNCDPLASSPYINHTVLAMIRCIVGFLSLAVLVYNVMYVYHPSDLVILLCSYHVWCWILMIIYFIAISFSSLCYCLSPNDTIVQTILRITIWIMYQVQLSLSFSLLFFMWLYLYFTDPKYNNYLYHFPDITMVSCNFLFIWSDFFINDIPLRFHYGIVLLLLSWIYLLFIWELSTLSLGTTIIYPFLDPSTHSNAIYYIIWILTHLLSWVSVYYIAFIKIKYQKKHIQMDKEWRERHERFHAVPSSTLEFVGIKPDGSISKKHKHDAYESVPDLMVPKLTYDDDDEHVMNERSPLNGNHSALTHRFVSIPLQECDDDIGSHTTFNTEFTDDDDDNGSTHHLALKTPRSRSRMPTILSMGHQPKSFHERMNSIRILADVQDAISQKGNDTHFLDKKARIEQELIDTEETYLDGLHILLEEFIKPIFKNKLIDKKYEKEITCNVPQIIAFHEQFLSDLYVGPIAKVFNDKSDFFKIYIQYICQYEHILDIFARFKNKNKKLQQYLNSKRSENKPLTNHLILPIQRIPRYMLLLSELKKNTPPSRYSDYKDIENALTKVTEVCNEINEKQREIENMSQCLQITETLKGLDCFIVEPQRKYIDHFVFKRKNDARNRQFFVFNDMVIIANPKWEAKRVIKLLKFEVKKPNKKIEEVLINIIGDNTKNKNYQGPIPYVSTNDIPEKDAHKNVSNVDMFCGVIDKYRDRLYINSMSRRKQLSKGETPQINLELIELIRQKKHEDDLKQWEQSSTKGDKNKVLTMLGGETIL